jgi:hypothetical protein
MNHAFWEYLGGYVYETKHNFMLVLIPIHKPNLSFVLEVDLADMQ